MLGVPRHCPILQAMSAPPANGDSRAQARAVSRVLLVEGGANLLVLLAKLWVALSTGALSVLGDALHSGSDLANNAFALLVTRISHEPPDHGHPYGHRKFETLAVFVLAMLLTVLAFELGSRALTGQAEPPVSHPLALAVMGGVLAVNVGLTLWQHRWAKRLRSPLLEADARHTLGDVLTTLAVIGGWQLGALGYAWADRAAAAGVSVVVFWLAFGLFRSAVPVLVDAAAHDAGAVREVAAAVDGVVSVTEVRSRWIGQSATVDLVITVDPELTTRAAHDIADRVEGAVGEALGVHETTVHVEPAL